MRWRSQALIVVPRLLSPATRTAGTSCPVRGRSICAHSGSCGEGFYLTFKGDVCPCLTIRDTTGHRSSLPLRRFTRP
ncbi:hypothetical protein B0H16DRAFT_1618504 [Mycena metata]|uniref:Secreted protein n=1 Tax=Mycena metata TaxID=1033252 RepID=A0AAD7MFU1_9AGAR|nr:hypothetical protein B0H16DRAFT_1618504 [Mycena metata]